MVEHRHKEVLNSKEHLPKHKENELNKQECGKTGFANSVVSGTKNITSNVANAKGKLKNTSYPPEAGNVETLISINQ